MPKFSFDFAFKQFINWWETSIDNKDEILNVAKTEDYVTLDIIVIKEIVYSQISKLFYWLQLLVLKIDQIYRVKV